MPAVSPTPSLATGSLRCPPATSLRCPQHPPHSDPDTLPCHRVPVVSPTPSPGSPRYPPWPWDVPGCPQHPPRGVPSIPPPAVGVPQSAHLEALLEVAVLLQEEAVVDDNLGGGDAQVQDTVVHCLGGLGGGGHTGGSAPITRHPQGTAGCQGWGGRRVGRGWEHGEGIGASRVDIEVSRGAPKGDGGTQKGHKGAKEAPKGDGGTHREVSRGTQRC